MFAKTIPGQSTNLGFFSFFFEVKYMLVSMELLVIPQIVTKGFILVF